MNRPVVCVAMISAILSTACARPARSRLDNAGQRDVDARSEDAVKRVQADGGTLCWSLVNELSFGFNERHLLLSRLWDILPGSQRPIAIASAWAMSDPPEECLPTDEWLEMFRACWLYRILMGIGRRRQLKSRCGATV